MMVDKPSEKATCECKTKLLKKLKCFSKTQRP